MYKPADLKDRLIDFAVRIINVVEALPNSKAGNHVAGQLIRSGTAPAPNYGEAQSAESRKDFIHTKPQAFTRRICSRPSDSLSRSARLSIYNTLKLLILTISTDKIYKRYDQSVSSPSRETSDVRFY